MLVLEAGIQRAHQPIPPSHPIPSIPASVYLESFPRESWNHLGARSIFFAFVSLSVIPADSGFRCCQVTHEKDRKKFWKFLKKFRCNGRIGKPRKSRNAFSKVRNLTYTVHSQQVVPCTVVPLYLPLLQSGLPFTVAWAFVDSFIAIYNRYVVGQRCCKHRREKAPFRIMWGVFKMEDVKIVQHGGAICHI